jgi:DNA-3-methyladenine glycosylase I
MAEKCGWAGPEDIYIKYHDHEWGVPQYGGRLL